MDFGSSTLSWYKPAKPGAIPAYCTDAGAGGYSIQHKFEISKILKWGCAVE